MRKIRLVFSLVLFLSVTFQVEAQWSLIRTQISGVYDVYALWFQNPEIGFLVDGGVFKTTDGGLNWNEIENVSDTALYDIEFWDENNGIAVGGSMNIYWQGAGTVVKTTNGGETWMDVGGNVGFLSGVCYLDSINLCAVGNNGRAYRSTDGGLHWSSSSLNQDAVLWDVEFCDFNNGYAVGDFGKIYRTTNSGQSWFQAGDVIANWLNKVRVLDPLTVITVAAYDYIYKTTDGGLNWTAYSIGSTALQYMDIFFVNSQVGWVVGSNGTILKTTNGGNEWLKQYLNTTYSLDAVFFVDENVGYTSGWQGVLLKTTNGGVTFIEEEKIFAQPTEFLLEQNYPNPFNPSTKISWQSPVSGWQTLKVYDILGNEVTTLVDEYKPAGSYEVDFPSVETLHATSLPSGVYFYQLKSGDYIETKKMILLK